MLLRLVFLTCWILRCGSLAGQTRAPYDHLEPSPNYFNSYNYEHRYYQALRDVLCAGLPDDPLARVVVRPSFQPEYVLSLEEKDQHYFLVYRVCRRSVWVGLAEKNRQPVPVDTHRVPLRPPVALAVARAFNAALRQTRYLAKENQSGLDGTQYTFAAFELGIGMRGGETWSPRPKTRMGALVELQKTMRLVALTPANGLLQERLLKQGQQLLSRLAN